LIEQLSRTEAMALLEAGGDARLGCIVDDEPYVVPIYYVLDGGGAYFHSLPGRKVDGMREMRRVCLQVQEVRSEYRWRSVQAFGDFEEIDDEAEKCRVLELLFARFPRLTPADAVRPDGHVGAPAIVCRVRIDRVVGVGEG
jgi:nitroimidazol reductase NimA-like FMN-containing flavoprotein (pyridoxamine 5'-phosphate oxidase superfamily)